MNFWFKFGFRLLTRLLRFVLIDLPLQLLLAVSLLIYLPFSKDSRLPKLLRWGDCADLYDFGRNPVTYLMVISTKTWFYRWYWLALRNPLNYFSYKYYAVKPTKSIIVRTVQVETQKYTPPGTIVDIGDSTNDMAGFQFVEYELDGKLYYEYYYVYAYQSKLLKGKCFRLRLGWKLGLPMDIHYGEYSQDCFNIQPFATYSGK